MTRLPLAIAVALVLTAQTPQAPEEPVNQLDNMSCYTYFSPHGGAAYAVINQLNRAKKEIRVAAYSFTYKPIADALVLAKKRGVDVEVVVDNPSSSTNTMISYVSAAGIPVFVDNYHRLQHNKYIVVDGFKFITGSFNFTSSAENYNAENLLVCSSTKGALLYRANWDRLKRVSQPYAE